MNATVRTSNATSTEEDIALVAQLVRSNGQAWKLFQERYEKLLCRSIARVTRKFHFVNEEDVRDIYANLMMAIVGSDYQKLRTFDPSRGRKLSSWLTMLAINSAHDFLRASKRHAGRQSIDEVGDLRCERNGAESSIIQNQHAYLVDIALSELSPRDQKFADLYFRQELSVEDVARELSIDVTTVYTKRHKVQARLETLVHSKVA